MQDYSYLRDPFHIKNRDTQRMLHDLPHELTHTSVLLTREKAKVTLLLVVLLVVGTWLLYTLTQGRQGRQEQPLPAQSQYCLMTQLFVETKGEFGWPDFNSNMHLCQP